MIEVTLQDADFHVVRLLSGLTVLRLADKESSMRFNIPLDDEAVEELIVELTFQKVAVP